MGLKELIEKDSEIVGIREKVLEIQKNMCKQINPLEQQIYKRKKQIVIENGFATRTVAEMSGGKSLRFKKYDENGIVVYKAKGTDETYMHCGFCDLYLQNDSIVKHQFNDTGDHSEGVHEAGTSYTCPICNIEIGKKIDFSVAID